MDGDFDALKREATVWIVRLTSGEATTEDGDALRAWRARSPEHERAFRETAQLWKSLGPALAREHPARGPAVTRRAFLAAGTVAASVAGVAFVASELGFAPGISDIFADHATAVGEQRTISLPDGSTAALDGRSSLSVAYSREARQVFLSAGAAVFEVEGSDPRPFVIEAAAGETRLDTGIVSVAHAVNDVAVTCISGVVEVDCLGSVSLETGEGVVYSPQGLGEKTAADIDTAAAWRKGLLIFNDRPLADVVADLNRHRRGKVMLARGALGSRRVSGVFHLDRPEEILAHFEDTLHVRSMHLVGGVVLLI